MCLTAGNLSTGSRQTQRGYPIRFPAKSPLKCFVRSPTGKFGMRNPHLGGDLSQEKAHFECVILRPGCAASLRYRPALRGHERATGRAQQSKKSSIGVLKMLSLKVILVAPVVLAGALVSTPSFAADKAPGSGPNPYADCGIGSALFGDTKWAAVTSNTIWDLGSTALTSATSSPETCSGKKVVAAKFISDTYSNLAEEAASGQGEHLTTVLNIMECDSANHSLANQQIRVAMKHSVSDAGYMSQPRLEKAYNLYTIITDAATATCGV